VLKNLNFAVQISGSSQFTSDPNDVSGLFYMRRGGLSDGLEAVVRRQRFDGMTITGLAPKTEKSKRGCMRMAVDESKLQQLLGKMLGEVGAAMSIGLVLLGDKYGLYKTLAAAGPLTATELASRTGTAARYVQEWAAAQAAGGYINFDPATERFSISPEQALVLADENGPAFFPAMFEIAAAAARDLPKVEVAFRTGAGVGWHEHDPCLFRGTERFFRAGYATHLARKTRLLLNRK
jgi:hypothetical protein